MDTKAPIRWRGAPRPDWLSYASSGCSSITFVAGEVKAFLTIPQFLSNGKEREGGGFPCEGDESAAEPSPSRLLCCRDESVTEPSPSRLRRATFSVVASLYLIKLSPGQFDSQRERQVSTALRSCTKSCLPLRGRCPSAHTGAERATFCPYRAAKGWGEEGSVSFISRLLWKPLTRLRSVYLANNAALSEALSNIRLFGRLYSSSASRMISRSQSGAFFTI